MSPVELERHLSRCEPSRREFLKTLILGTAYATPIVASFGMDGLGVAPADAETGVALSNLCDPMPSNNFTEVVISKTAPESIVAGELLTYTIEVYNCGPFAATDVNVEDPLPEGAFFVSSAQTAGGTPFTLIDPMVDEEAGTWQATAPSLAVGESACFEVVVRVAP